MLPPSEQPRPWFHAKAGTKSRRNAGLVLVLALAVFTTACSRLDPPTITPQGASIKNVTPNGIELDVQIDANNPNGLELEATAVKAKITVDNKDNAAAIAATEPLKLAPRKHAAFDVPFSVTWSDPTQLAGLADPPRTIAYHVEGAIEFTAHGMRVETPFTFKGTLTHEQIVKATAPPPPATAQPTATASASAKPAASAAGKPRHH